LGRRGQTAGWTDTYQTARGVGSSQLAPPVVSKSFIRREAAADRASRHWPRFMLQCTPEAGVLRASGLRMTLRT